MRLFDKIWLHCSASRWGSAHTFDKWHREDRGWREIGYHWVILNGWTAPDQNLPWINLDGCIESGRRMDDDDKVEHNETGAHVYGANSTGVGICMVGNETFTDNQFISVKKFIGELSYKLGISYDNVYGHYEIGRLEPMFAVDKTCPNIPMEEFRAYLHGKIDLKQMQKYQLEYVISLGLL